jgi:hypothetical protein
MPPIFVMRERIVVRYYVQREIYSIFSNILNQQQEGNDENILFSEYTDDKKVGACISRNKNNETRKPNRFSVIISENMQLHNV